MKSLFAVLLVSALSPALSFASQGDGRNGPQLSGSSIPVQVDHAITKETYLLAMRACEMRFAADLFQQAFATQESPKTSYDLSVNARIETSTDSRDLELKHAFGEDSLVAVDIAQSSQTESNTATLIPASAYVTKKETVLVPTLHGKENPEYAFDRWQNKVLQRVLMTDIKIDMPTDGAHFALVNYKTGRPVLMADAAKVARCLVTELQK